MTDAETTVLYILSTLAQTCAALAAFVGAVGLYRLQSLANTQRDFFRDLHVAIGTPSLTRDGVLERARGQAEATPVLRDLLKEHDAVRPKVDSSRRALMLFEGWNLLVIGASLVAFNHVPALASCRWTSWAVWAAAVGTVAATARSVYVWTKE